ncbi:LOW QUALITY PROTEIN: YrdC/Sua5 family protein [Bacillus sp. JCM 19047]|nr:LOW QUALITY PROTEIN: YrdC/Sua5 family protein [Bacillus sp. JCM 19047]
MSYKQTKVWNVDNNDIEKGEPLLLQEPTMWIRDNKLIAFPTETVYGLGANALSDEAVSKIFYAKGRPSDNPLIVHIGDKTQLNELVADIPEVADRLMEPFGPGALTLIFKAKPVLSTHVTAGLETVGIRMPSNPVARAFLKACQLPIAAPSANQSGRPSPTTAAHVLQDLNGRIDGVIDGGQTGIGLESTVLSIVEDTPVLYRPGGVTKEEIEGVVGPIGVDKALVSTNEQPKSPGMKYTHYAPEADVYIVEEPKHFHSAIQRAKASGLRVGVLASESYKEAHESIVVHSLYDLAQTFYYTLRLFDEKAVTVIFVEAVPTLGVGAAIMNRLEKAAGGKRL